MKKIGILTFNRPINYGAVLQAFALKEKINAFNKVEIINYICPYIENLYKPFHGNKLKGIICFILNNKRNKKFYNFISAISSERIYGRETLRQADYEKIIVGSDQVWNYYCSGKDETFLLPNFKIKKYSYAASFGVNELPEKQVPFFKEQLSKFRYISVREKTGQDICGSQLGLSAEVVLDPTLLLTKEEWVGRFHIQAKNKKYILVYAFEKSKELTAVAKYISKLTGLPIYSISVRTKDFFGNKAIKGAGPKEWVELFYNATFIVTDSFHGTAFSVNFNKTFYAFAQNNRASRIIDLLEMLGLQNRLNPMLEEVNPETEIDYNSVNEKLEVERKKSIAFIEKIIND